MDRVWLQAMAINRRQFAQKKKNSPRLVMVFPLRVEQTEPSDFFDSRRTHPYTRCILGADFRHRAGRENTGLFAAFGCVSDPRLWTNDTSSGRLLFLRGCYSVLLLAISQPTKMSVMSPGVFSHLRKLIR